jgi:hypothetical protein
LLAEKLGAAGRWMADAMGIDAELFELCSGDFSQRYNLIARK